MLHNCNYRPLHSLVLMWNWVTGQTNSRNTVASQQWLSGCTMQSTPPIHQLSCTASTPCCSHSKKLHWCFSSHQMTLHCPAARHVAATARHAVAPQSQYCCSPLQQHFNSTPALTFTVFKNWLGCSINSSAKLSLARPCFLSDNSQNPSHQL